jgi:hypothetical protein
MHRRAFALHGLAACCAWSSLSTAEQLHVEPRGERYVLVDDAGRERLLRGINLATLGGGGAKYSDVPIDTALYENGRCPPNNNEWYQPPVCEADVQELAALGYDAVRLLVHWSQIEPAPGEFSAPYFARVNQLLDWCGAHNVSVLLDFHQDNYANLSHACCADDGAPPWAWLVDPSTWTPAQRLEIDALGKLIPQLDWSGAEVAFAAFWRNFAVPATGRGLQEHYVRMLAATANATRAHWGSGGSGALLGFELMNEPLPGLDLNIVAFADGFLYPFYRRAIQALTGERDGLPTCDDISPVSPPGGKGRNATCAFPDLGVRYDGVLAFEPMALRNQLDVSPEAAHPVSNYSNLAYAPHTYSRSFTLDKSIPFALALDTAVPEALAHRAALLVTEWGGGALANVAGIAAQQQVHVASALHWVWKQNGGGGWGLFAATDGTNFTLRQDRLAATSRITPRRTAGELLSYAQDASGFNMSARCDSHSDSHSDSDSGSANTEIYFPAHFAACASSTRVLAGAAPGTRVASIEVNPADGSVVALVVCTGMTFSVGCSFPAAAVAS